MNLADFRQQYPAYDDMPDAVLADSLYQRFYADMPRATFDQQLGLAPAMPAPAAPSSGLGGLTVADPMPVPLDPAPAVTGRASVMPSLTQELTLPDPVELLPGGQSQAYATMPDHLSVPMPGASDMDASLANLSAFGERPGPSILDPHWSAVTGGDRRAIALGQGTGGPATPDGVISGAGDAIRSGALGLGQSTTGQGAAFTANAIRVLDRIDRGEAVADGEDPVGYQYMSPQQRQEARAAVEAALGDAVWRVRDLDIRQAATPAPAALRAIGQAKSFGEAWDAFMTDPFAVIGYTGLQSAVSSSPGLVLGGAGRAAGGVRGFAAGMGLGSAGVEYASTIIDAMEDGGVDLSDSRAVAGALSDPAFMDGVRQRAAMRAAPIGAMDALGARVAGTRLFRGGGRLGAAGEVGAQFGVQASTGMAGEALGQAATGDYKPGDILLEGVAEGFTTPYELGMARFSGRSESAPPVRTEPQGLSALTVGPDPTRVEPPPLASPFAAPEPAAPIPPTPAAPVAPGPAAVPRETEQEQTAAPVAAPAAIEALPPEPLSPLVPPQAIQPAPPAAATPVAPEPAMPVPPSPARLGPPDPTGAVPPAPQGAIPADVLFGAVEPQPAQPVPAPQVQPAPPEAAAPVPPPAAAAVPPETVPIFPAPPTPNVAPPRAEPVAPPPATPVPPEPSAEARASADQARMAPRAPEVAVAPPAPAEPVGAPQEAAAVPPPVATAAAPEATPAQPEPAGNQRAAPTLRALIERAISGAVDRFRRKPSWFAIGRVDDVRADEIAAAVTRDTGRQVDVHGYIHYVDEDAVRKILNDHGNAATEAPLGQLPVTPADIEMIPEVISRGRIIEGGATREGLSAVVYEAQVGDTLYYVEEVRTGRKGLAAKTMWKRRPGRSAQASSNDVSSERSLEALPGSPSPDIAPAKDGRNSTDPAERFQTARDEPSAPPFYSALSRGVEGFAITRGPREQWAGAIRNLTTKGVKAAEIEWSGVEQWLRDRPPGPITKQDVLEYLRSQEVRVDEVVRQDATDAEIAAEAEAGTLDPDFRGANPTKYGTYTLPGGQNYRELLLTLPAKDTVTTRRVAAPAGWGDTEGGNVGLETVGDRGNDYRSGHFDEPNILAHVRFNERTDAAGNRVLFIEEIQSDWHQAGRRRGYAPSADTSPIDATGWVAKREAGEWTVSDRAGNLVASMIEAPTAAAAIQRATEIAQQERTHSRIGRVPDAPLKGTWQETAFRRMVRWAAENGFDKVAWTTGEQQAERFDLSKHIDSMKVIEGRYEDVTGADGYWVTAQKGGREVINKRVARSELPDLIGKEMADKALTQIDQNKKRPVPKYSAEFSGLDLKVGGEGMRGFYDKMLVDYANKWGKKFGARVDPATVDGQQQHALPITPQMRDSVMREGVPLWQQGRDGTRSTAPVDLAALKAELHRLAPLASVEVVNRIVDPLGRTSGAPIQGAYRQGSEIFVAAYARDPMNTLRHEAVHALRDLNLIRPEEWRRLSAKAASQWMREYRIAERYPGLSREAQYEEAVAEAFADHKTSPLPSGFRAIYENIKRFFDRLVSWLNMHGFQTVEDVLGRIESGEVGARRTGREAEIQIRDGLSEPLVRNDATDAPQKDVAPQPPAGNPDEKFQTRRLDEDPNGGEPVDIAADGDALADLLAQQNTAEASTAASPGDRMIGVATGHLPPLRTAEAAPAAPLPRTPDLHFLAKLVTHPRTIALNPKFKAFAPVYESAVKMFETRDRAVSELARIVEPYSQLSEEEKRHVNAVLEIGRLKGEVYAGRTIGATNTVRTTDLSRFNDTIVLTPAEREGYLAVRATMDRALDLFRDHLLAQWGFDRPGGPTTAADFKALIDEENKSPSENGQLARYALALQGVEDARRTGYVPFSRFGQIGLTVRDQLGGMVHFEKIDTDRFVGSTIGRRLHREAVAERRRELMQQYPAADGFRVSQPIELRGPLALSNAGIQLSDVDALAELGGADPAGYELVRTALEDGIKKASFRSHLFSAKQTAGYSPDFERSIADYITGVASYIARRQADGPMQDAIGALAAAGKQPRLTHYARRYHEYVMSPINEWQTARQLTFLYYLTSPATGMVNMSQVPLFSAPYLSGLTNPARVSLELGRAYKDAAAMLSVSKLNPERGVEAFDPDKAPADVRDAVRAAFDDGYLVPQQTFEQMAKATGSSPRIRGLSKNARTAMDALAAIYTITERTNRIVTFIATLRLARGDPAMLAKLDQQMGDAPLYGLEVGIATPEKAARWITDETQFKVGKVNRPEAMRGPGAWLLQFKGFIKHALELQWRQLRQYHGAGAKTALALNVAGLLMMAGLFGFPGADDLKDLAETIYKFFAKQDVDIEREVRQFMYELTGSSWLSESAARGLGRQTGVDFAKRVGMGDIIPRLSTQPESWSVVFDMTWGRSKRLAEHLQRGDYLNAVAETLPALIANPMKALGMLESGVRSQKTGRVILPPEKVGAGDIAARALGFTSSNIARRREAEYAETRAKQSTAELRTEWYTQLARALAAKARAERAKDADASIAAVQRFRSTIDEIKRHNASAAPQDRFSPDRDTLKKLFQQEMMGADGRKVPKKMQGEREKIREIYGVSPP